MKTTTLSKNKQLKSSTLKALFTFIIALSITTINAQEFSIGPKAGLNVATLLGDFSEELKMRTGFHIGVTSEIPIAQDFYFSPELVYSSIGAKFDESEDFGTGGLFGVSSVLRLNYLTVPLMARYYISDNFGLDFGPYASYLLSAKQAVSVNLGVPIGVDDTVDVKEFHSDLDFGLGAGATFKMRMGIFFQARATMGFANVNDTDDFKNQNLAIQISAGYMF